jgi:hypothetical protein
MMGYTRREKAKSAGWLLAAQVAWIFVLPVMVEYAWSRLKLTEVTGMRLSYWDFFWATFALRFVLTRYRVKAEVADD